MRAAVQTRSVRPVSVERLLSQKNSAKGFIARACRHIQGQTRPFEDADRYGRLAKREEAHVR